MPSLRNDFIERRKYLRLYTPIPITYTVAGESNIHRTVSKNISADGLSFEATNSGLTDSAMVELKLDIPAAQNPIHATGRVVWKKKISLEDGAPHDCGIELTEIEEDNKNTFLKFLCDLMYDAGEELGSSTKKH